jgi:hypothetical protein
MYLNPPPPPPPQFVEPFGPEKALPPAPTNTALIKVTPAGTI